MSKSEPFHSRLLSFFASAVAVFAFAVIFAPGASAADPLTFTNTFPSLTVGTKVADIVITIDITTATDFTDGENIAITFPDNLPEVAITEVDDGKLGLSALTIAGNTALGVAGVTESVSGRTLTITIDDVLDVDGAGRDLTNGDDLVITLSTTSDTAGTATPLYAGDWDLTTGNFTTTSAGVLTDGASTAIPIVAADAAATLTLGNNSVVGAVGDTTLNLTLPVALAADDTVVFTAPSILNVISTAYFSDTFTGAGAFSCAVSGQVITCTADGVIDAGTATIVMTGILANIASSSTITSLTVSDTSASSASMATDSSGAVTVTTSSSSGDSTAPAAPTDIALSVNSSNQVVIIWTDPSDSDLDKVEILRGVGSLPVSGTAFDFVGKGVETYTDSDVSVGDVVKYILRSKDSSDNASNSSEYSITVEASATIPAVPATPATPAIPGVSPATPATPATPASRSNRYRHAGVSESEVDLTVSAFHDLKKGAWHAPFIARLRNMSVLGGYPDGTIQPDRTINRAELAKIAAKSFNLANATETFSDVPDNSWFAPFVGALQKVGASWTTTANYRPSEGVTRGEALQTLLAAAGVDLGDVSAEKLFSDVSTRHRSAAAISFAAQNGIVNGYDNGNFGPGDMLTRGQVAKIVALIKDL